MHRVIVTLKAGSTANDKAAVRAAQDEVLEALSGMGVTINRRYDSLPMLALTVSSDALSRLRAHPTVVSVQDDGVSAPSGKGGFTGGNRPN